MHTKFAYFEKKQYLCSGIKEMIVSANTAGVGITGNAGERPERVNPPKIIDYRGRM